MCRQSRLLATALASCTHAESTISSRVHAKPILILATGPVCVTGVLQASHAGGVADVSLESATSRVQLSSEPFVWWGGWLPVNLMLLPRSLRDLSACSVTHCLLRWLHGV